MLLRMTSLQPHGMARYTMLTIQGPSTRDSFKVEAEIARLFL